MSDSSDEADGEIVFQENSKKFESEEGEHVDAIRQETRGHKAVDHKNKRRRVSSPSDKDTNTSDDESESGQKKRRRRSKSKKRHEATKNGRRTATEHGKNQKAPLRMGIKIAPLMMGINIRGLNPAMTVSQISDQWLAKLFLVTLIVTVINIAVLTLTRRRNRG